MNEGRKKVTVLDLKAKKERGEPITMVTAYDYPSALIVERVGIDILLVGDSLGMVVLGYENTVPVTMDEMIHHAKAVRRGASLPFLVGDMPFMSYEMSIPEAIANAGRFLKEAGMDCIKLEGGREMATTVRAIYDAGIPVMGHIGLTPQSVAKLGGFKVQGKDPASARKLIDDALVLEDAGVCAILLEAIPDRVAKIITEKVSVPTLGIGAGPHCDGQVLILHDILGLFDRFTPKFAKRYINLFAEIECALAEYRQDVISRTFPGPEHCFTIKDEVLEEVLASL
ncbi:MAG: 3-methyl-2-oxobutanoate hydroxymethyltransferase [Anaerolineae bacterium]